MNIAFKSTSSLLASLVLIASIASVSAQASSIPKVGKKCPIVGFEQNLRGQEFVCKKIGKKLQWQKVILAPISLDNLDLKQVPKVAYVNVINELNTRKKANFSPTVFASTTITTKRIDDELQGLSRAIDFFAPYFLPQKFQVVYVTSKDLDWMNKKSDELGLGSLLPQGETWESQLKISPCVIGSAGKANGVPTFIQCLERPYTGGYRPTGPHEYTHLFQRLDRYIQNPWYMEGSATFFGWTLAFHPYDPLSRERSGWVQALFYQVGEVSVEAQNDFLSKDMARFKSRMKSLSNVPNTRETAGISYWVGGLATEALIAVYGMEKFFKFAEDMRVGKDLDSSMLEIYGVNADTFYEKLAPYAWAQMG